MDSSKIATTGAIFEGEKAHLFLAKTQHNIQNSLNLIISTLLLDEQPEKKGRYGCLGLNLFLVRRNDKDQG